MPKPVKKNWVTISEEDWASRTKAVKVSKDDLNLLVLDYLIIEGYTVAARNFCSESGITCPLDFDSIDQRMKIKQAILKGDIEDGISRCNDLDPEILSMNPRLHFTLLLQRLIELIRQSRIPEALIFAQTDLAPKGESNPEFLSELEKTLALLAFDCTPSKPPVVKKPTKGKKKEEEEEKLVLPNSLANLLLPSQRIETANLLNMEILKWQNHGSEGKLKWLMRMLSWGEGMLEERTDGFPRIELGGGIGRFLGASLTDGIGMDVGAEL